MALSKRRTTQSVATLAQQTLDEEKLKKQQKAAKGVEKKQAVSSKGLGGDAVAGATAGAAAGPVGAAIGAVAGAGLGLVSANQTEEDPNRPKRRRLGRARDRSATKKRESEQALATLSAAVFDWAASIR